MKYLFITLISLSLFYRSTAQVPVQNYISPFHNVKNFEWKTPNGLPYSKDFSGNYSVEVYQQPDNNHYAFLSKSAHAILVFNRITGLKEKEISLPFSPVDLAASHDRYYVAGTQNLYVFDSNGKITNKWFFGKDIKFVNSMKLIDNHVYMISTDQKTWSFDKTHTHLIKHDGIILKKNLYGKVFKRGKHQFEIDLAETGKEAVTKIITDKKLLGTVRISGISGTLLYVEVQTILHEVPLKVKRNIRIYQTAQSDIHQVSSIALPDMYYTYIKHDIVISDTTLDILITTPEKAGIYQLKNPEPTTMPQEIYLPRQLYEKSYLYNDHLLPSGDENESNFKEGNGVPITRQKIINNAEPYATHKWYCNPNNIRSYDCGGVHVTTPSWVKVGDNISVPYMWGGFSSLDQFDQGLLDGVSAGDSYTHGNGAGSTCAVGVDCSGFVSRAWGLGRKYSTRSIPDISTQYASYSQLLPGDVVNYAGHHVRLVHTVNGNGSFLIIEASGSGTDWRVGYNNYTTADLQGRYYPRYYNNVIADQADNTAPTTRISVNDWETVVFRPDFTDNDNIALKNRFFLVSYFDGNEWLANSNNGFFLETFSNSISPRWKQTGGSWSLINKALNQSDETSTNPNIYTTVQQKSGHSYLYQWRMKIGGTGSNRRAGLYIMVDNPTASQRNNAYMIYFRVDDNTCQIYKAENNSINLETSDNCTVDANKWFDAKVIYNTETGELDVYKDNILASSWIDVTPLTSGNSISLRTGNANVSYDDIKIYRSRTTSDDITIGTGSDLPFENSSPTQPAGMIFSIVTDSANNISAADSVFVNIDWTKPSVFTVNDGTGSDIDSTHDAGTISANWTVAQDSNSAISNYFACVGTSPGNDDEIPWFNNDTLTHFTKSGLSLNRGTSYFVSVAAMNGAGLISDTIVSDGLFIQEPLGIIKNGYSKKDFLVYPVPVKNALWVKTKDREITNPPEIITLSGKQVKAKAYKISATLWKINLKQLVKGIYIVSIKTRYGTLTKKFTLSR